MTEIRVSDLTGGAICGCDCGCSQPITDGNLMSQELTPEELSPGEPSFLDTDEPTVHLIICAECYVGNHKAGAV
jgi:hypothetical protein